MPRYYLVNTRALPCRTCGAVLPCYTRSSGRGPAHRHHAVVVDDPAQAGSMPVAPLADLPPDLQRDPLPLRDVAGDAAPRAG